MDSYLAECRTRLSSLASMSGPIELVLGNESSDLDSCVAANVMAFIKHVDYKENGASDTTIIPVLNVDRNELKLRTEVMFWFEHAIHISTDLLICKDEIDFKALKNKKVSIILVDHNENKEFCELWPIIEIIDHHKPWFDEQNSPVSDPSKINIDVKVGSCCTLIAERFLQSSLKSDSQLALMLYGTIILDTICLSTSAQRFSDRDISVIERLEKVLEIDISSRSEVYQQLIEAKNSTNNLNIEELLKKDMKLINTNNLKVIVSSISGTLTSNLNLVDKRNILERFSIDNKYDAIVILGIENSNVDHIKRDITLYTKNHTLMQSIISSLESKSSELELKQISEGIDLRTFSQNNARASRKVILPIIQSAFQGHKNEIKQDKVLEPSKGSTVSNNKETELEIASYDMSKLNNPESVYGSYIEDSFVGELVGDYVNETNDKDGDDSDNNWTLNNGINNEIEFEFDSFGPESIIYTGNGDTLENKIDIKPELHIKHVSDKMDSEKIDEMNKIENNLIACQTDDVVENNCSLSPNDTSSDSNASQLSPFKRNSSLTQSQRKKISPRINLQMILNSSDEMTPTINSESDHISHPLSTVSINDKNDMNDEIRANPGITPNTSANKLSVDDEQSNRGLVRRPSTTKKKIPVNRELFNNEESADKHNSGERSHQIEELSAREELDESRSWRQSCPMGPDGDTKPIDMKVIDPYKKVISHGGYFNCNASQNDSNHVGSGPAIIVFAACYLPDRSRKDYNYVMENLFMYVLTTLHNLIADDYILIYFHNAGGGPSGNNMPTFGWLKRCYYMIDRKLKKNLKGLYLIHPTFWLKTLIIMSKPFISSKFSKKLKFIGSLSELSEIIPIEHIAIPEPVKMIDFNLMIKQRKKGRH